MPAVKLNVPKRLPPPGAASTAFAAATPVTIPPSFAAAGASIAASVSWYAFSMTGMRAAGRRKSPLRSTCCAAAATAASCEYEGAAAGEDAYGSWPGAIALTAS